MDSEPRVKPREKKRDSRKKSRESVRERDTLSRRKSEGDDASVIDVERRPSKRQRPRTRDRERSRLKRVNTEGGPPRSSEKRKRFHGASEMCVSV